jgi:hypothetical protein
MIRAFFSYAGAKYNLSKHLGPPQYADIIEPFAGSACYSCRWAHRAQHVTLFDRDPMIIGIWKFLQSSSSRHDIERLPDVVQCVDDDLPSWVCAEARWLIGFNLDRNGATPVARMCNWGRTAPPEKKGCYWGKQIKARILNQLELIRDWDIREGNYWDAPDVEAHWHIDPPYRDVGVMYRCHQLDYDALAQWCLSRSGFIQAMEGPQHGDWLPFQFFRTMPSHRRPEKSHYEFLFEKYNPSS